MSRHFKQIYKFILNYNYNGRALNLGFITYKIVKLQIGNKNRYKVLNIKLQTKYINYKTFIDHKKVIKGTQSEIIVRSEYRVRQFESFIEKKRTHYIKIFMKIFDPKVQ